MPSDLAGWSMTKLKDPRVIGGKARKRRWDEGVTAVEAAIILPIMITLLFGIVESVFVFWRLNTMEFAIEQAGRWAMLNHSDPTLVSDAEARMTTVLSSASACTLTGAIINPPAAGNVCVYASATPSTISLTAIYAYNLLGISGPFTVTSQSTFPLD
jgi:Flp pilus assembly protein TadG